MEKQLEVIKEFYLKKRLHQTCNLWGFSESTCNLLPHVDTRRLHVFLLRVTLGNVDISMFIDTFYIKGYMFTCFF